MTYSSDKFKLELAKMRSVEGWCSKRISDSLFISKKVRHGLEHYAFMCYDDVVLKLAYDPKTRMSWIKKIYDPYNTGTTTISEFLHEFHDRNDFSSFIWEIDDLNGGTCVVNNLTTAKYPMYNCTRKVYIGEFDPAWEKTRASMIQDAKKMHSLLMKHISKDPQGRIKSLLRLGIFNLELLTIQNNFGFKVSLVSRVKRSTINDKIKDILLDTDFTRSNNISSDFLDPYELATGINKFSAAKKMYRQLPFLIPTDGTVAFHKSYIFRSQALFPLLYCAAVPNVILQECENKHYKILTYNELKHILVGIHYSEIDLDFTDTEESKSNFTVHLEDIECH